MIGRVHRWKGGTKNAKIVCFHGFLGSGKDFKIVADHSRNFSEMVAPNFPDYQKVIAERKTGWNHTLSIVKRFIEEEAPNKKTILLGYSMGGRIALQFAIKFPQLIEAVILIGSTPGIENKKQQQKRRTDDSKLSEKLRTQPYAKFLEYWFNQPLLKSQKNIPTPYLKEMLERRKKNDPQTLAYYLSTLGTGTMPSAWTNLHRCKFPTLLVTGSADLKFTIIAEKMLTRLPDASHAEIKKSGHAPCFENAEAFGSCLDDFIAQIKCSRG